MVLFFLLGIITFNCKNSDEEMISSKFDIFDCNDCTYIISSHATNGSDLDIKPGDILCLESGVSYKNLLFSNIRGTDTKPVYIRNCGGRAVIQSTGSFGIKFRDSDNFKLIGDGGGSDYGIKISTHNGFFLLMEHFTTDFEVAHVEIAGNEPHGLGTNNGFAGIGIKTSPYQDCDLFTDPTRQAWIMKNVTVRDSYIHDTGGEGLYIGHGFYTGRKEADCPEVTYSHSIKNLRVHDNIIENTGYDGMQIKNADDDVEVYNNVIRNYGTRKERAHNEGLFLGGGVTGKFYNNIIAHGSGDGMRIQAMGNLDIYNNIVLNAGEKGINIGDSKFNERLKDGYFNVFNNTIVNSAEDGLLFNNPSGGTKRIINNIVAGAISEELLMKQTAAEVIIENNITILNVNSLSFENLQKGDLRLRSNSPAVDTGKDLSSFGIKTDILGNDRPNGKGFDVGAYEF